jgi:ApaG protein
MYQRTTRNIHVSVEPIFLDEQSTPDENYYVWAYKVQIKNEGPETVQLRSRCWKITDAQGRVQEIRGQGVVGEQPVLKPGGSYEYTSGAPLSTPSGFMVGNYQMRNTSGETFEVEIPLFSLDSPFDTRRVH